MGHIKNIISLLLVIFIAFLGIKFSAYGLLVNSIDNDLHEISLSDINAENLKTKRYLSIKDENAASIKSGLEYADGHGKTVLYVYPLLRKTVKGDSVYLANKTNIVIGSKEKITNWNDADLTGLLKPYWHSVEEEVIQEFAYRSIFIEEDAYYLELEAKPYKWYWYVLILSIVGLFFFRMIQAMMKGIKKKREEKNPKKDFV